MLLTSFIQGSTFAMSLNTWKWKINYLLRKIVIFQNHVTTHLFLVQIVSEHCRKCESSERSHHRGLHKSEFVQINEICTKTGHNKSHTMKSPSLQCFLRNLKRIRLEPSRYLIRDRGWWAQLPAHPKLTWKYPKPASPSLIYTPRQLRMKHPLGIVAVSWTSNRNITGTPCPVSSTTDSYSNTIFWLHYRFRFVTKSLVKAILRWLAFV